MHQERNIEVLKDLLDISFLLWGFYVGRKHLIWYKSTVFYVLLIYLLLFHIIILFAQIKTKKEFLGTIIEYFLSFPKVSFLFPNPLLASPV